MKVTNSVHSRSSQSRIPGYSENGALQLIVASGVPFVMFHFTRIVLFYCGFTKEEVFNLMFPKVGLSTLVMFQHKWWTPLTYGWIHHGFFDWFTNAIWLYCFGAILQMITSYKQVIPLFIYGLIAGGLFYYGCQYFPYHGFEVPADHYFLGAQAGVMALAIATLTFAPKYSVHIAPGFTIPLVLIVAIYIVLDIVAYLPGNLNVIVLCSGGAITGFIYALLLKNNFRPGEWVYDILDKLQKMTTPAEFPEKKSGKRMEILRTMYEPKKGISQMDIDALLDKINETGYHSLTMEEKKRLESASKE